MRKVRCDEAAPGTDVVRLASRFGRYGYRQITNLLRIEGWQVNHKLVRRWLARLGVQTLFIEPGSPWEHGYNESFNGTLRNEFLSGGACTIRSDPTAPTVLAPRLQRR